MCEMVGQLIQKKQKEKQIQEDQAANARYWKIPAYYDDDSRDILIREQLPDNYSLPLPENESFHFDIPLFSRPPVKLPDGNTRILNVKMMGDISDQKVPMPRLMITRVSNQEKSFDLLSHRGLEIF
nr:hypothetical protein [Tanacetum cinerariifolium]